MRLLSMMNCELLEPVQLRSQVLEKSFGGYILDLVYTKVVGSQAIDLVVS